MELKNKNIKEKNYIMNSISLLAKWMKSENASSSETKRYAKILREGLNLLQENIEKHFPRCASTLI